MSDRLKVFLQHLLPKRHLTSFAGRVAGAQGGAMTTRLIRWFVGKYGVDMSEAADPDIAGYRSFNDFFTRPLKAGARPLAEADFICPVDGAISQFGAIDDHHILQAKGHRFTTTDLVGGDAALAAQFRHGSFANLYLSPRDRPKGAMREMPNLLEAEDIDTIGASVVADLTWKQIFDTDACTICGRCTSVCPANITGKPLDPREMVLKSGEVATSLAGVSPPVSTTVVAPQRSSMSSSCADSCAAGSVAASAHLGSVKCTWLFWKPATTKNPSQSSRVAS